MTFSAEVASQRYSQIFFLHNQAGALCEWNLCMFVFNQTYENTYCVDIIHLILHQINNYWYNLVDLTSSPIYENNAAL